MGDIRDVVVRKLTELAEQKVISVADLRTKVDREDWHGVVDAAMDVRDIETEEKTCRWTLITLG